MTPPQGTGQDFSSDAAGTSVEEPKAAKEERQPGPDLNLIRAGATIIAILGLLALLHFAASVFITLFSAMMLAFALEPLVHLLCVRTRLRRHHASGIVVFLFVAMLYGLFYATYLRAESFIAEIPAIAEKIRDAPIVKSLTTRAEELNRVAAEAGRRIAPPAASARPKAATQVVQDVETFTGALLHELGSLGGVLFSLGFIPFLVYFILADREPLTRRTRELFPERHRTTVGVILLDIEQMMRKFLLGNAVIALILSTATVLVFLLVGLPYPVVLGILSGTLSIVPYLGLPLALLPGGVVGLVFFESGGPFLALIASVTVFHLVAANYLTPKLVGGGVRVRLNAPRRLACFLRIPVGTGLGSRSWHV
ncbi:MAG: AI-2E family transporter [Deltaproteobacteria bacterium]|nr:AI-2E family transporter [Candidatus Deferrimicrobium borealis]